MLEATYDIFRGAVGAGDERWLEAVRGLENARKRMEEIAAGKPGLYFIFHVHSHSVVGCADTRVSASASSRSRTKIA